MTSGVDTVQSTSTSQTITSTAATKGMGKDEFLKLLTYQLKAQNPLKPYDNQEFASQLAQFSQLEQLTSIKSLIEEQNKTNSILSQTFANSALPGMIGKYARAATQTFTYSGESSANMGFTVPYNTKSGSMTITDEAGNTVKTINLSGSDLNNGDHTITWDGTDNNGNKAASGKYNFTVNMVDSNNSKYAAQTFTKGRIDGVRFKQEGTLIIVNGNEVPLNTILDITSNA